MKIPSLLVRAASVGSLLAIMATTGHAQIVTSALATYDFYGFNGNGPDPETAMATTNGTITASNLMRSPNAPDPTYIGNTFAFDGADQSTLAGAISAGRYVQFTVTPTSTPVVLTSLTFYGFARNSGSTFALTSNGGSTVYSTTQVAQSDPGNNQALTLDFTNGTLPGVAVRGATTFDIYFYGNSGFYNENGFGNGADNVDFTINGGNLPEPSTYGLLGVGALLLLTLRRFSRA